MKTEITKDIDLAVSFLNEGNLVAIPTETVYGLGGVFGPPEVYQEIFKVKGRPSDNPLIVHIGEISWIYDLITSPPTYLEELLERFFPGPLTLVLKKASHISPLITANLPTIAIRMPSHPTTLSLLKKLKKPIVAPSANLSGRPSPTSPGDVFEDFSGKIPLILDGGNSEIGIESTVLSLVGNSPAILRPGIITREEIESFLNTSIQVGGKEILSPGMKYRHYAPKAPILLFDRHDALPGHPTLLLSFEGEHPDSIPFTHQNFYQILRKADREKIDHISIFIGPKLKKHPGLLNRVEKAAGSASAL